MNSPAMWLRPIGAYSLTVYLMYGESIVSIGLGSDVTFNGKCTHEKMRSAQFGEETNDISRRNQIARLTLPFCQASSEEISPAC